MRILLTLTLLTLVNSAFAQDEPAAGDSKLSTNRDKVSYAIGMNIGRQFQQQGVDVDPAIVAEGIATILNGGEPLLTQEQIQAAFLAFQAEQATANKKAANDFLTQNATKEGVQKTKTGLQYIVLREGDGKKPTAADSVSTHYRGRLMNGKVFDQSYEGEAPTAADQPVSFGVTQVIGGWTEALQLMNVGAKYRLFIPPALAYGEQGNRGIPANSLLIFDIELVDVKSAQKP
ncbi:MAG: FKBP-type peptidyl-prolyl cis-trans isomerase [Fuerstiella sp.]